ncbi:MAG: TonB-dependent receptor [Candidatus Omnitrophica bacterium]|nr:TonB-dependent receptor [Candidatus Omnitrophota bacterium]
MKTHTLITISLLMSLTGLSFAQAQDQDIALEKIVVTPYRYAETLSKSAASITVITPSEIKNSNAQNVVSLLRSVPGVTVRDYYGNGIRALVDMAGFGDQAALNVLVLIDGRRVNDVDLSGVDWSQIPLDQVERIEVIRGGASCVLYGDNASSGVINIITKKGSGKPKLKSQIEYGSYDMNKQKLSLAGGIDDKLSYLFSGGREATHGYRDNTFVKATDFASKLEYEFNSALSARFSSGFDAASFGLPGALFQHHIDEHGYRWARYGDDHVNNKDYYFVLGGKLEFLDSGYFDLDFSYREKDTDSYFLTSQNPTRKNKIETFGLTPKYTLTGSILERENRLIAGIDYYRALYNSDQYFFYDETIPKDITGVKKTSVGAYLQDEFSVLEELVLVGGYRYELARYAFGYHDFDTGWGHPYPDQDKKMQLKMQAFNFGLAYNYKDDSNAFFNVSRSFRFPEVDEFTFQDINFQQQLNTNLKPQSAINYQLGLRHKFSDRLRGSFSLFRMYVKNELYFNPNGGPWGFGQNENYDKTIHEGLESSLEAKLNNWISFLENYTLTRSYFKGGQYNKNEIPMVPRHKASVGLRFLLPNSFTFNITGNYVGKRYFINDTPNAFSRLNGYMVADVNLSWRNKDLALTFSVNNLFDKQYSEFGVYGFDSSTFLMDKAYYPSPKRNFSLKVDYTF